MFESALLDRLSRVHPVVPLVIFIPAIAVLFALGQEGTATRSAANRGPSTSAPSVGCSPIAAGSRRAWSPRRASPCGKASFAGSKSSIRVGRNRRFAFRLRATRGLTGTAVFTSVNKVLVGRKQRITLARKRFTVPVSGRVTLRIKLSNKRFRILKLNRHIRARVTVTLKNSAGLTSKASKRITLKAPKRKRRR